MKPPGAETVLVRYGDVGVKSARVRGEMEERLVENLRAMVSARDVDARVERYPTRPRIRAPTDQVAAAAGAAADTTGVVSASPALSVPANPDSVLGTLAKAATECYSGGSFAVDARRAGDAFPLTSQELNEQGGQAVWDAVAGAFEPEVDLDDPDLTFNVEVREEEAFLFFETVTGPGGMPLGSQRPVVALVSGGIDSPVAAYEVMRKGSPSSRSTSTSGSTAARTTEPVPSRPSARSASTRPTSRHRCAWCPAGRRSSTSPRRSSGDGCSSSGGSAYSSRRPSRWRPVRVASSPARPSARSRARPSRT